MPTDLEETEAAEAAAEDLPEGKNRWGLFILFLIAFIILATVSTVSVRNGPYEPWVTHPSGRVSSKSDHPHLHATGYRIAEPYDTVRSDIFGPLNLLTNGVLTSHCNYFMFGLMGRETICKLPLDLGTNKHVTLVSRRLGRNLSIALITAATTNTSELLVIDHRPDQEHPYHTRTLTAQQHLYPTIRHGPSPAHSPGYHGGAHGLNVATYTCNDPLSSVIAYYLTEFSPTMPTIGTKSPALLLSPANATNATHLSLFLQTHKGPKFIHAAEDKSAKETHITVVDFYYK